MSVFKFLSLWAILLVVFSSCSDESKDKYVSFSSGENTWNSEERSHIFNEKEYKATQMPLSYFIEKNNERFSTQNIDSVAQTMANERIVVIEFRDLGSKDLLDAEFTGMDYNSSVEYMAFTIQKDFQIKTSSGKTLACKGVQFERNFNTAPFKRLLLHFGDVPEDDNYQLLYNDHLFGSGLMKFNFNQRPIKL